MESRYNGRCVRATRFEPRPIGDDELITIFNPKQFNDIHNLQYCSRRHLNSHVVQYTQNTTLNTPNIVHRLSNIHKNTFA